MKQKGQTLPHFPSPSATHKNTSHMEQVLPYIFPSGPWIGSLSRVQGSFPFLTSLRYSLHSSCQHRESKLGMRFIPIPSRRLEHQLWQKLILCFFDTRTLVVFLSRVKFNTTNRTHHLLRDRNK